MVFVSTKTKHLLPNWLIVKLTNTSPMLPNIFETETQKKQKERRIKLIDKPKTLQTKTCNKLVIQNQITKELELYASTALGIVSYFHSQENKYL